MGEGKWRRKDEVGGVEREGWRERESGGEKGLQEKVYAIANMTSRTFIYIYL